MPASLFATLSGTDLDRFSGWAIVTFGAGTVLTCLIGFAASRWVFGRELGDQAISGMASGYVNSANLGIPVAVQLLGDTSFIVSVMLFQVLIVTPVVLTMIDVHDGGGSLRVRDFLLLPLRNPIIIASALGVAVAASDPAAPAGTGPCRLLGAAAVPAALVTLGMSLHGRTARGRPPLARGDHRGRTAQDRDPALRRVRPRPVRRTSLPYGPARRRDLLGAADRAERLHLRAGVRPADRARTQLDRRLQCAVHAFPSAGDVAARAART